MSDKQFLHVALILGAHGVKGEVKVSVLSENPQRLQELSELSLLTAGGLFVRRLRFSRRIASGYEILQLEGIFDRDAAQALKGSYLSVTRDEAAVLPEGRYYIDDLIGLNIVDSKRGPIGRLKSIFDNGAQDVYEITREGQKPLYLPIHADTFQSADLTKKEIYITLPEGLWEIYE